MHVRHRCPYTRGNHERLDEKQILSSSLRVMKKRKKEGRGGKVTVKRMTAERWTDRRGRRKQESSLKKDRDKDGDHNRRKDEMYRFARETRRLLFFSASASVY